MRYPGGKSYIANKIFDILGNFVTGETIFVDVFSGGLTMTVKFCMQYSIVNNYWINDKDPGIACIWTSYIRYPDEFIRRLSFYKPTVELFFKFKDELSNLKFMPTNSWDIVDIGIKKLMLHQCSYSGLGLRGGVQGGNNQDKKDKIDTNWNLNYQEKKVRNFINLFNGKSFLNVGCTDWDFRDVISNCNFDNVLLYLDPPYYEKGKSLYYYYFDDQKHIDLANCLKNSDKKFVLSYDDCDFIRNLYDWAEIDVITNDNRLQMKSNISGRTAYTKNELVITRK
jgi:DNA adenine methylase